MTRSPSILAASVARLLALLPALVLGAGLSAGAELVVMLEARPKTLDPVFATDANGVRLSHQLIFDTLLTLDDELKVAPGLALSWEKPAPDRLRLAIKPGVRFHDGAPLDARDVVYTLQSLMDPAVGSPYGPVLREKIADVRAVGDLTVEIDLRAPYASFLTDLLLPVRSRRAGREKPLVGSGPFRFESQNATEIVLVRNDAYHGPKAGVERVRFKVVRDENTRLLKLWKGSVDLAINVLPLDKLAHFRKKALAARFRILEAPGLSYQYLGFNLRDPVLGRKKVRRAIAHAINVPALITHRQKGHSTRASGLFPPGSPFAEPDLVPIAYDPERARRLLDEAGFVARNGRRFRLTYKTSTDRSAVAQARAIQSDLRQVGIAVEVRSYEWATFYDDIGKGNFQLFSLRWIGVTDPDFYYELFHSSRVPPKGRNRVFYRNREMDRLLEAGRVEGDPARRRAIYGKVSRLLHEDLPYFSLWHNNVVAVVSRALTGFKLHPTGGFQYLPAVRKAGP